MLRPISAKKGLESLDTCLHSHSHASRHMEPKLPSFVQSIAQSPGFSKLWNACSRAMRSACVSGSSAAISKMRFQSRHCLSPMWSLGSAEGIVRLEAASLGLMWRDRKELRWMASSLSEVHSTGSWSGRRWNHGSYIGTGYRAFVHRIMDVLV